MSELLRVEGLHAGYGAIRILRDLALHVGAGEYLGLWGHNGMGKSTLMRAITGFIPATQGQILFEGRDIGSLKTHERARVGLGYVPQGRDIFGSLTVMDNLRMGCLLSPEDPDVVIEGVLTYFPRLLPLLQRNGGQLSGGEQQLLALARCLCGRPKLILLDEPTEGIQPSIVAEMVDTLKALRSSAGLSMVVVEQNQAFIAALADRVVVMQKGRNERSLSPRAFLEDAALV
jgi:branched-chain amino acid transport system ATP-binding protein